MPTTITPMRDFVSLRDALDKLFEDSFIKPPMLNGGASFPIDLYETPEISGDAVISIVAA